MDIDFEKGEAALRVLLAKMQESNGQIDDAELVKLATDVYEAYAGELRPVIAALPGLTEKFGGDIAPIFAALVGAWNAALENAQLREQVKKASTIRAVLRFESFSAHKEAGFTDEQAMAFVLQDALSNKLVPQLLAAASKSSSSKNGESSGMRDPRMMLRR